MSFTYNHLEYTNRILKTDSFDRIMTPIVDIAIDTIEFCTGHIDRVLTYLLDNPSEVAVESIKRVPVFVLTDTAAFVFFLHIIGYIITPTLVLAVATKALLLALIAAPLSYIIRKVYREDNLHT